MGILFFLSLSGLGTGLDGWNIKKKLKRKGLVGWLVGWFTWAGLIFGVLIYLLHSLFSISVSIYSGRFTSKASEVGKKKVFYFLGGLFSKISSGGESEPFGLPVWLLFFVRILGT